MKNIVLLGHTGFVGSNVLLELSNHNVQCFSLSKGYDLRSFEVCKKIAELKPDVLINCAAHVGSLSYVTKHAAAVMNDNLLMLVNIYKAFSQSSTGTLFINPVANCSYPGNLKLYDESKYEDGPMDSSVFAYGSTRRTYTHLAKAYHLSHGMVSINFLTPNIFGPGDSLDPEKCHAVNALISKFVISNKTNSVMEVWGDGSPVREWLYVKDFVRVIVNVINNKSLATLLLNQSVNIAQERGFSIKEIVDYLVSINNSIGVRYLTDMPNGAPIKVMKSSLFKEYFADFEFTPFKIGFQETYEYYLSQHNS